jgi:uncharacterized protein
VKLRIQPNRISLQTMRRDELSSPLHKKSLGQRLLARRPTALALAYGLTICGLAALAVWAIRTPMPFAGEPIVLAQLPVPEEMVTATAEPVADAPPGEEEVANATEEFSTAATDAAENQSPPPQATITIEPPVEQDTYHQQDASIVISPRRPLTPAPVAALTEYSPFGLLPKIGEGNKKPSLVYARTTPMNVIHSRAPKIAIVLGGMGLNSKLTTRAVKELPADVTLAFAPYGEDLQNQVNAARKVGHEVFLQVPLEPVGFPATNPGPKTLLADAADFENLDSLHWHMSRFQGYAGIVSYMGGRFLANEQSIKPVLVELKTRGLLFVEDGSLPMSATADVATATKAQTRKANVVIDADASADSILQQLRLLESEAETNGFAIGTGSGLAITIDTLRDWAKDASERGILIVPVSAAFKGRIG